MAALPLLLLLLVTAEVASALEYTIPEEQGPGSFVGNVAADADLVSRYGADVVRTLEFSFLNKQKALTVDGGGVIRTAGRIDRETVCPPPAERCQISADVAVTPAEYFQIINVVVDVTDINDNAPFFTEPEVTRSISELAPLGAHVRLPTAVDPDWGANGVQEYRYTSSSDMFRLEVAELPTGQRSVSLVLTGELDREDVDLYQGTLTAYDGGPSRRSGSTLVKIIVEDGNDHSPTFDNATYAVTIAENSPVNSSVVQVTARDADIGDFGRITYAISSPADSQVAQIFGVSKTTGWIYLKRSPDYEDKTSYTLLVEAKDGGPNSQPAQATVQVNIRDLNDNPPEITVNALTSSGVAQISESSQVGTFVAHVSVTDSDAGQNGRFSCVLDGDLFALERLPQRVQYKIVTAAKFDRETQGQHFIRLTCRDQGSPAQVSVATVTVNVLDENDNPPQFVQNVYSVRLTENNPVDAYIVTVNATDPDVGPNAAITYELRETSSPMPLVRIDPKSGAVYANVVFDYESQKEFHFKVVAADGGSRHLSATATVFVTIADTNDNAPFFSKPAYEFDVLENEPIGMEIGLVAASDADSEPYDQFEFSFMPSRATRLFAVDTRTGHIRTKASLDREYAQEHLLTVLATNIHEDHMLSSSVQVRIVVRDQNDNAPHVDFPNQQNHTLHISNLVPVGYEVGVIRAHDVDADENARLAYSFTHNSDNSAFHIDPVTGLITTRASLENYDTKLFEMQVLVSDHGTPPKTATATLYVVVDKSIAYANGPRGSSLLGGTNLSIVIGLAVSSAIVVVILVVAIILTRMHPHKNNARTPPPTYKNPISGFGFLRSGDSKSPQGQAQLKDDQTQNNQNHAKETSVTQQSNTAISKKEVSFNIQNETVLGCSRGGNGQSDMTSNKLTNNSMTDNYSRPPWTALPTAASADHVKCQQWFDTMKPDPDTDNSSAGEVSTTDSGRGPSEEGENSLGSLPPVLGAQGGGIQSKPSSMKLAPGKATRQITTARPPQTHPPHTHHPASRPGHCSRRTDPQHPRPRDGGYGPRSAPPRSDTASTGKPHEWAAGGKPYGPPSGAYGSQSDCGRVMDDGEPWYGLPTHGDVYGDNASTTSGSYIVDHKDLDDMIAESPSYTSVVV